MSWRPFPAPAWRRGAMVVLGVFEVAGLTFLLAPSRAPGENPPAAVRVGLAGSLFRGTPEALVRATAAPFRTLVRTQTGLDGELVPVSDAGDLADRLADGRVDLAVFHGVDFARAQQEHPTLKPLVIVVNQQREIHAYLLVRQDGPADAAALAGKPLALPAAAPPHCALFLAQEQPGVRNPRTCATAEDALDDVVDGTVGGAVVDGVALRAFQRRKPGRYERLRELARSQAYPPAVVAYRAGALDRATLDRFRDGLLQAGRDPASSRLLNLWRITAFEPVPPDFDQLVAGVANTMPRPRAELKLTGVSRP